MNWGRVIDGLKKRGGEYAFEAKGEEDHAAEQGDKMSPEFHRKILDRAARHRVAADIFYGLAHSLEEGLK